jgi:hypothetical protein
MEKMIPVHSSYNTSRSSSNRAKTSAHDGQKLLPKNLPKDTDPAQFRILD